MEPIWIDANASRPQWDIDRRWVGLVGGSPYPGAGLKVVEKRRFDCSDLKEWCRSWASPTVPNPLRQIERSGGVVTSSASSMTPATSSKDLGSEGSGAIRRRWWQRSPLAPSDPAFPRPSRHWKGSSTVNGARTGTLDDSSMSPAPRWDSALLQARGSNAAGTQPCSERPPFYTPFYTTRPKLGPRGFQWIQ